MHQLGHYGYYRQEVSSAYDNHLNRNEPILELNNRPIKPWRAVNALFSISIVSTNANSMPSCSLSNNALFKNGRSIAAVTNHHDFTA